MRTPRTLKGSWAFPGRLKNLQTVFYSWLDQHLATNCARIRCLSRSKPLASMPPMHTSELPCWITEVLTWHYNCLQTNNKVLLVSSFIANDWHVHWVQNPHDIQIIRFCSPDFPELLQEKPLVAWCACLESSVFQHRALTHGWPPLCMVMNNWGSRRSVALSRHMFYRSFS